MKDYVEFEEFADELPAVQQKHKIHPVKIKKVTKLLKKTNNKSQLTLNQIYEMKMNNSADYTTENFEKLE